MSRENIEQSNSAIRKFAVQDPAEAAHRIISLRRALREIADDRVVPDEVTLSEWARRALDEDNRS